MKGNIEADRLAKLGAGMDGAEAIDSPQPPIESLKDAINEIILRKQREIWLNGNTCKIARTLWPKIVELNNY